MKIGEFRITKGLTKYEQELSKELSNVREAFNDKCRRVCELEVEVQMLRDKMDELVAYDGIPDVRKREDLINAMRDVSPEDAAMVVIQGVIRDRYDQACAQAQDPRLARERGEVHFHNGGAAYINSLHIHLRRLYADAQKRKENQE